MSKRVARGPEMSADEAGKDWRDEGGDLEPLLTPCYGRNLSRTTYIRINIETLVFKHGGCQLNRLRQDKDILEVVGDFLGYELHKIWY